MPSIPRSLLPRRLANLPRQLSSFALTGVGESSYAPPTHDDTIFALATGNTGAAGVAVVRISGAQSYDALAALLRNHHSDATIEKAGVVPGGLQADMQLSSQKMPKARRAALRKIYDPHKGDLLDEALVLCFPGPNSFTGEDVVELQIHGSRAVISGILEALSRLGGLQSDGEGFARRAQKDDDVTTQPFLQLRPAEAGEFTQRAFGNGRLRLTEVEGLADLLRADTSAQRRQALKQMGGAAEEKFRGWRKVLQKCLAHSEAAIDFGDDDDEEDVDADAVFSGLVPEVSALRDSVAHHLRDGRRGEIIRSGVEVAIVGPPNVGKSTLLNVLAKRDAAIVADIPGTTRDVLEVRLDLAGVPVIARDTAGLRRRRKKREKGQSESTQALHESKQTDVEPEVDAIEAEGIRRARAAAIDAHLVLFVVDSGNASEAVAAFQQMVDEEEDVGIVANVDGNEELGEAMNFPTSGDAMDFRYGEDKGQHMERWMPQYRREMLEEEEAKKGGARARGLPPMLLVLNKCDQAASLPRQSSDGQLHGPGLSAEPQETRAALQRLLKAEGITSASTGMDGEEGGEEGEKDTAMPPAHVVSCRTGEGLDELMAIIENHVAAIGGAGKQNSGEPPLLTRERHRRHAAGCLAALDAFLEAANTPGLPVELAAEELRIAARELGRVVGAIDVEEVLDVLFKDFCIGK